MGILVPNTHDHHVPPTMTEPDPFPSYLDPLLNPLNNPILSHPFMPISPDSFYGTSTSNKSLHPPLCTLPQAASSGTSSTNLSRPPTLNLSTQKPIQAGKGRRREEFTAADLDNLLCTTIEVNPFSASWKSIGEAWKEVTQKTQAAGFCLGHHADMCKNCVASLLAWCEVSH